MNTICRIARIELATLFFSPVAWLVIIIFTFQTTFHFFTALQDLEMMQQMVSASKSLTELLFSYPRQGLFTVLQDKLFLYIPLLTMGLLSREISSGSIKLLLSSPIKASEIVLGKFLAMVSYGLLLMIPILLVVLCASFSIPHLDIGMIVSGMFGLYLLICAYSTIGLFMSTLTSYQVVAAISTLAVLAALNYIGYVWQNMDFIRDLTYFLSISGRADEMINGLIRSKDIFYFLLVILLFLGFSYLKLRQATKSNGLIRNLCDYILLTGIILFMGYISSRQRFAVYIDLTANHRRTITPLSQSILKQVKEPVNLTTYVNVLDGSAIDATPGQRNVDQDRFEMYTRFLPSMSMDYIYYYDLPRSPLLRDKNQDPDLRKAAEKAAELLNVNFDKVHSPDEINRTIDLKSERNTLVRQLSMGKKHAFLRMFEDVVQFPQEAEITTAFKLLSTSPVRIGWITGHSEPEILSIKDRDLRIPTTYPNWRYNLINQGFNSRVIALRQQEIPVDISILVLIDPRESLETSELNKIRKFIAGGGNLLICAEPGQERILNPVLALLGISMNPGMLVQSGEQIKPDVILASVPGDLASFSSSIGNLGDSWFEFKSSTSFNVLDTTPFKVKTLLRTDSVSIWNKINAVNTNDLSVSYLPREGDTKANFNQGLLLKRSINNKEQRIALIGDADFLSNRAEILREAQMSLTRQVFKWLAKDEFPIDIASPKVIDNHFSLNKRSLLWLKIVYVWGLSGLLLLIGGLILVKRNRK